MIVQGLHHITIVFADAQRTIDFYTQALGQRLVKKTVNFDDPGSYHLYFGDETGQPGTAITFFSGLMRPRAIRGSAARITTPFRSPTTRACSSGNAASPSWGLQSRVRLTVTISSRSTSTIQMAQSSKLRHAGRAGRSTRLPTGWARNTAIHLPRCWSATGMRRGSKAKRGLNLCRRLQPTWRCCTGCIISPPSVRTSGEHTPSSANCWG